jgi:hypothetical protein
MKAANFVPAGVAVLVALSADVGKMHIGSPDISCDGGGRCGATTTAQPPVAAHHGRRFDASGSAAGVIMSSDQCACARWRPLAARFQAYSDDLENNHGARAVSGRHRPAAMRSSSIRAKSLDLPFGAARSIRGASCPAALPSVRSPLRTDCSKAGAGAIPITVMRRSM